MIRNRRKEKGRGERKEREERGERREKETITSHISKYLPITTDLCFGVSPQLRTSLCTHLLI
jgi:hypothetical protein